MKTILLFISFLISVPLTAQVSINIKVSPDTVSPGEPVEVVFSFENGDGHFNPPDMRGLPLISGPNISSSFTIQNGSKSSRQSYTYIFRPQSEGVLRIPESSYTEGDSTRHIESLTIIVGDTVEDHTIEQPLYKSTREKKKI